MLDEYACSRTDLFRQCAECIRQLVDDTLGRIRRGDRAVRFGKDTCDRARKTYIRLDVFRASYFHHCISGSSLTD